VPAKKGAVATTGADTTPAPASPSAPAATPDAPSDNKTIRSVGPTFIPPRQN
jgi:hypothetical protein